MKYSGSIFCFACTFIGATILLTACNLDEAAKIGLSKIHTWMGKNDGLSSLPKPEASGTPFSSLPPEERQPSTSELAKAHSELLSEMMKVIFNQNEVENKSAFGELTHSLNEGASLEGIYRGIIMGSRFRALESTSQAASPETLKAFANEMTEIQADMKDPTEFSTETARHAPKIDMPDGSTITEIQKTQNVKQKQEKKELTEHLLGLFIGASPYTLKRVLAEEALRKMDEVKDSPGELAQWYAKTVVRLAGTKIDFGLPQRNQPDYDFHFKFAQRMAADRVKWEILNRYHRYLNFYINK